MLEYVFRNTTIKCLLYIRKGKVKHSKEQGKKDRREKPRADALVIEQQGTSYADLLKSVKQAVRPESLAAKAIRNVRESRSGKMVIVLSKEGHQQRNDIKRELNSMQGVSVRESRQQEEGTVNVDGIDSATSQEEVAEAIRGELQLATGEFTVGTIRQSFGGNRAVTVRLPKEKAGALIDNGGPQDRAQLVPGTGESRGCQMFQMLAIWSRRQGLHGTR